MLGFQSPNGTFQYIRTDEHLRQAMQAAVDAGHRYLELKVLPDRPAASPSFGRTSSQSTISPSRTPPRNFGAVDPAATSPKYGSPARRSSQVSLPSSPLKVHTGSFFSDTNRLANHFWPVSLFLQTRGLLVTRLPPKQNRTMNRLPSHVPQANTTQRWPLHFFFWFNRSKYFWRATNCPSNLRLIQSEEPLVLHNLTSCRSLHDQNIFRSLTRHVMASKLGYLWSTE